MPRALFEKTGNAVYMSHLDLMRVFQRAFKRAGLHLTHTQGFSPRPSVSIALPMSVGMESVCELLDFDLEGPQVSNGEILQRLNNVLVDGVRVRDVYENGNKIKNLSYLDCAVYLEYDAGVPGEPVALISELFARPSLVIEKQGKNGITQQDVTSMIRKLSVVCVDENTVRMDARICCQNPTLNPAQLTAAIARYLPDMKPDFARYCRMEIYNQDEEIFR